MSLSFPLSSVGRSKRQAVPRALADSSLSATLPTPELAHLDRMSTMVTLQTDRRVIRQTDIGRQFLVVLDGALHVDRDGKKVAVLEPGDMAGEVALLTGHRCNADVTADAGTTVYALNRRELSSLLHACPQLHAHVTRTALRRVPGGSAAGPSLATQGRS